MKKVHVVMQIEDPADPKGFFLVSAINFPGAPEACLQLDVLMPPDGDGERLMRNFQIPMRESEREEIVSVLGNDKIERMRNEIYNLESKLREKDKYIKELESKLPKED